MSKTNSRFGKNLKAALIRSDNPGWFHETALQASLDVLETVHEAFEAYAAEIDPDDSRDVYAPELGDELYNRIEAIQTRLEELWAIKSGARRVS